MRNIISWFLAGGVIFQHRLTLWPWHQKLLDDPLAAARAILTATPVIDGHIDLPILARIKYANNVSAIDLNSHMPGHVDIPRLRQGQVGGFFWSVYFDCSDEAVTGPDFINATWVVRDTLEQIDVARLLIEKYPETFRFTTSSADLKSAMKCGKIASLLGVEGAHQIGNSLAVLRQYYALGVRYMTLTHACHNAFADAGGLVKPIAPLHNGLSDIGRTLVREMNRLGMLIDLSHTSDATALQVLKLSRAPVIWSHSSARTVFNVSRNVPDNLLALVGEGEGKTDAVVMVNFAPLFLAPPGNATLAAVADHMEHIGRVIGKKHVGIGSDYDGIESTPIGLEDVSTYPALIAELYSRGWTQAELAGLTSNNLLRVLEGAERVAHEMRVEGVEPAYDIYEKRLDLPVKRTIAEILNDFLKNNL